MSKKTKIILAVSIVGIIVIVYYITSKSSAKLSQTTEKENINVTEYPFKKIEGYTIEMKATETLEKEIAYAKSIGALAFQRHGGNGTTKFKSAVEPIIDANVEGSTLFVLK